MCVPTIIPRENHETSCHKHQTPVAIYVTIAARVCVVPTLAHLYYIAVSQSYVAATGTNTSSLNRKWTHEYGSKIADTDSANKTVVLVALIFKNRNIRY